MDRKNKLNLKRYLTGTCVTVAILISALSLSGCSKELARLEQNQLELQTMIQGNTDRLTAISVYMEQNQHQLQAQIENVRNETLKTGADITAVGNEQIKLFEKTQNNSHQQTAEITALMGHNRQELQAGIENVQYDTLKVATNVKTLGQEQNKLREAILDNNQQVAQKMIAAIEENQQEVLAGFRDVKTTDTQIAANIAALGRENAKLYKTTQENNQRLVERIVSIRQNQQALQAGVEGLRNETTNINSNVAALGSEQAKLHKTMQSNNQKLAGQVVAVIEENQNRLQAGIEGLSNETGEIADKFAALGQEQIILHNTVQENNQQLAQRVDSIEQNQQQGQAAMDGMQESVRQVSSRIDNLGQNISRLQELLQKDLLELVNTTNVIGQEQLKFQDKVQRDLQMLSDSFRVIEQSQNELKQQIEFVQYSTDTISNNVPAAIERLKEEISKDETANQAE